MLSRIGNQVLNLLLAAVAAAAFLLLFGLAAQPAEAQGYAVPMMQVEGEGEVTAVPDIAHVEIGVRREARDAAEAADQMAAALEDVLAALEAAGIPETDIRTGRLSLDPLYTESSVVSAPRVTGFAADVVIDVTVKNISATGAVLDAAISAGANRIDRIRFDLDDRSAALAEARRLAVADARSRAVLYAEAAGVALGDLVRLDEGGGGFADEIVMMPPPSPEPSFRAMAALAVPQGELTITARVNLTYAMVNTHQ